jgi:hypothetical protein
MYKKKEINLRLKLHIIWPFIAPTCFGSLIQSSGCDMLHAMCIAAVIHRILAA